MVRKNRLSRRAWKKLRRYGDSVVSIPENGRGGGNSWSSGAWDKLGRTGDSRVGVPRPVNGRLFPGAWDKLYQEGDKPVKAYTTGNINQSKGGGIFNWGPRSSHSDVNVPVVTSGYTSRKSGNGGGLGLGIAVALMLVGAVALGGNQGGSSLESSVDKAYSVPTVAATSYVTPTQVSGYVVPTSEPTIVPDPTDAPADDLGRLVEISFSPEPGKGLLAVYNGIKSDTLLQYDPSLEGTSYADMTLEDVFGDYHGFECAFPDNPGSLKLGNTYSIDVALK